MDTNDLMSSLSGMLSDPKSMEGISEVAKMFAGPKEQATKKDTFSEDMAVLMGRFLNSFNRRDNRIDLLNSIRPYMKESRMGNIDMAIRVIKILNVAKDFNIKDVKNVSDV